MIKKLREMLFDMFMPDAKVKSKKQFKSRGFAWRKVIINYTNPSKEIVRR